MSMEYWDGGQLFFMLLENQPRTVKKNEKLN